MKLTAKVEFDVCQKEKKFTTVRKIDIVVKEVEDSPKSNIMEEMEKLVTDVKDYDDTLKELGPYMCKLESILNAYNSSEDSVNKVFSVKDVLEETSYDISATFPDDSSKCSLYCANRPQYLYIITKNQTDEWGCCNHGGCGTYEKEEPLIFTKQAPEFLDDRNWMTIKCYIYKRNYNDEYVLEEVKKCKDPFSYW